MNPTKLGFTWHDTEFRYEKKRKLKSQTPQMCCALFGKRLYYKFGQTYTVSYILWAVYFLPLVVVSFLSNLIVSHSGWMVNILNKHTFWIKTDKKSVELLRFAQSFSTVRYRNRTPQYKTTLGNKNCLHRKIGFLSNEHVDFEKERQKQVLVVWFLFRSSI